MPIFRDMYRIYRVFSISPKNFVVYFIRLLKIIPGVNIHIKYMDNYIEIKKKLRKEKFHVGHAMGYRSIELSFFKIKIIRVKLNEGIEATLDQFYINRSLKDIKKIIQISKPFININSNSLIFDPGCGAGKHLFYLTDKYNCKGIGVDVYAPAIEICKLLNINRKLNFYNKSALDQKFLKNILPNGCDVVFINSWLNHVINDDYYRMFSENIESHCKFLMVITSKKDDITKFFKKPNILHKMDFHKSQLLILKGKL